MSVALIPLEYVEILSATNWAVVWMVLWGVCVHSTSKIHRKQGKVHIALLIRIFFPIFCLTFSLLEKVKWVCTWHLLQGESSMEVYLWGHCKGLIDLIRTQQPLDVVPSISKSELINIESLLASILHFTGRRLSKNSEDYLYNFTNLTDYLFFCLNFSFLDKFSRSICLLMQKMWKFPRSHIIQPSSCFLQVVPFFKTGSHFMSCTLFISSWLSARGVEGGVFSYKVIWHSLSQHLSSYILVGGRGAHYIQILMSMRIKGYDIRVWDFWSTALNNVL